MKIVDYGITTNGMMELHYEMPDKSIHTVLIPFNSAFEYHLREVLGDNLPF